MVLIEGKAYIPGRKEDCGVKCRGPAGDLRGDQGMYTRQEIV